MRTARLAAISADRDLATKQAFEACVAAVKDLIGVDGPIKPDIQVGRITTNEFGWLVATTVSAWVWNRAAQAAVEGLGAERAIHTTGLAPDPWFCGAVEACLPMLADACFDAPWDKPINEWPKEEVVAFLLAAHELIQSALAARDTRSRRGPTASRNPISSPASSTPRPATSSWPSPSSASSTTPKRPSEASHRSSRHEQHHGRRHPLLHLPRNALSAPGLQLARGLRSLEAFSRWPSVRSPERGRLVLHPPPSVGSQWEIHLRADDRRGVRAEAMNVIDFNTVDAPDELTRLQREPLNIAMNDAVDRATASAPRLSRM